MQMKKTEYFQLSLNTNCNELLAKMKAELGKYNDTSGAGFNSEAMSYYSIDESPWLIRLFSSGSKLFKGEMNTN